MTWEEGLESSNVRLNGSKYMIYNEQHSNEKGKNKSLAIVSIYLLKGYEYGSTYTDVTNSNYKLLIKMYTFTWNILKSIAC